MTTETLAPTRSRNVLGPVLWTVQGLLSVFYLYGAFTKLATPIEEAAKMMPWAFAHPTLLTVSGIADLAGGLGILLPALTRIRPRLSVLAAAGMIALQVCAMGFHASRGEFAVMPLNVVLFALAVFVLWGRTRAVPFAAAR